MPNIYSSTGDGWAQTGEEGSWVNARRSAGASSNNFNAADTGVFVCVSTGAGVTGAGVTGAGVTGTGVATAGIPILAIA